MARAAIGNGEIKLFIWQLDATLENFSGVVWIENVGKVARLKDAFLRKSRMKGGVKRQPSIEDISNLARCLDALSQNLLPPHARGAVFDKATVMIEKLLDEDIVE